MHQDGIQKRSKWIWYNLHEYDLVNTWMQARRTFDLKAVPKTAEINVTADTNYRLYVNGVHVLRGPARGFQASWPYDTIDIAPYLKKGQNVIAALVHHLGVGTFQYYPQGNAGFLLWGMVGKENVSTGTDWKVRESPGNMRTLARTSLELNFQEVFNSRADDGSWIKAEYDDGNWKTPLVRSFACMPWPNVEPRGIPHLKEEIVLPLKVVSKAQGKCTHNYLVPSNITKTYLSESVKWAKAGSKTMLNTEKDWATLEVPPTGEGNFRAYCLDYGHEVVGSLRLRAEGASGCETVDYLVTEALDGKAPILELINEGSRPAFGNRIHLRAGVTEHEQFDHWGQRYVVIIVRNSIAPLILKLRLHWVGYPLEVKAAFESSDKRLNRIYEMCVWSQQCCMLDAYIDCPWREQAQWWGDARVQGRNTFYLSADTRLFKRGIIQIGTQESDNGLTYGVAPTTSHRCILPDFSLVWILTHWDYYWQTGELSLFKQHKARMHRLLAYFEEKTDKNGLIPYDDRYWLFLDWHPIFKDGYPAVYNLLYLWALRAASDMFKLSRDKKSSQMCKTRAKALQTAIERRLWNRKNKTFYGGLDWNGRPVEKGSVHSLALGILLDLFPEHHEQWVAKHLVPMVRGEYTATTVPSPYFMHYIFEALKKKGRYTDVIDCIRRWWGGMLDRGLTTTEEIWNGKLGKDSLCHAWSAHPIVHLSDILLGIQQESVAWKTVRFSPTFAGVSSARGKVATPKGEIEAEWVKKGGRTAVRLDLPKGVKAIIDLPGIEPHAIEGRGLWLLGRKR